MHAIHFLLSALKVVPPTLCYSQLAAIDDIRDIFSKCSTTETHTLPKVKMPRPFAKKVQKQNTKTHQMHPETNPIPTLKIAGTPTSKGAHIKQIVSTSKGVQEEPIATRTQSQNFTPTIGPSNPQQYSPVASRTMS